MAVRYPFIFRLFIEESSVKVVIYPGLDCSREQTFVQSINQILSIQIDFKTMVDLFAIMEIKAQLG